MFGMMTASFECVAVTALLVSAFRLEFGESEIEHLDANWHP